MTQDSSRIVLPDAPADQALILQAGGVACWTEPVLIDTYDVGEPDRYPMFIDRRVYQGSSGRVYPLPMIDSISNVKVPVLWDAIHLENQYVRLMLLPQLGGRIHIGYDKVSGYDFFYRNNVIKPALVGLAGPWISGGVEFNWPQHHRPATFLPVETAIDREHDGAVVVWHSDLDPLQRMRGTHGIRLRPNSSVVEADVRLHNRTDRSQTFLWWANVAARSHDQYQSFFPDDVGFVADHARRAISAFPRADRPYYGVDYPRLATERPGADRIDVYSNIPVPTSYMITDTSESFFGGYDHAANAGFVHWADRAIAPGKKQWTWGDGAVGHAWDDQLTDGDGPYVELMAGVFTDNQPDFSWLMPGETKLFSQYWYPIHGIGPARQATLDAAIAVSRSDDAVRIAAITTIAHDRAAITVTSDGEIIERWAGRIAPDSPQLLIVAVAPGSVLEVTVEADSIELAVWADPISETATEPWVATVPPSPADIESTDELVITATHLTQYRHPTRSPIPYYLEALRRDSNDSRARTALGSWNLTRGEYTAAREHLEAAVRRLTTRNANPADGEAHYLLGLVLERLGHIAAADERLARSSWNAAWAPAANLARARIALRAGDAAGALRLAAAAGDIPEAHRLGILARIDSGDRQGADQALEKRLLVEPLDAATSAVGGSVTVQDPRTALEVGAELARAGAYGLALAVTESEPSAAAKGFTHAGPIRHYLRACWQAALGLHDAAADERRRARATPADLAFPAGLDQYDALGEALAADPEDHVAAALLGMWLLDAGRYEDALIALDVAIGAGSRDPVAWRNFGLALVHAKNDLEAADSAFEFALTLRRDPRLVLEKDALARLRDRSAHERLGALERFSDLLESRDDLALLHVNLLLDEGRTDEAWGILTHRVFRPFEGGEGQVIAAFDRATCARARSLVLKSPYEAITLLSGGVTPPRNLGEGRHPASPQSERLVLLGDAFMAVGESDRARDAWYAAQQDTPLAVAPRAVDERDFWRGIAHVRLGDFEAAGRVWTSLEERANELELDLGVVDYFATSLPELLIFDTDTAAGKRASAVGLRELSVQGRALVAARTTTGGRTRSAESA